MKMNNNIDIIKLASDMTSFCNAIRNINNIDIISRDKALALESIVFSANEIFNQSEYKIIDILKKYYEYEHAKNKSISGE